jgi:hypothetical protein
MSLDEATPVSAQPRAGTDPLVFPPHFPPTTRWKKFFIGVRWLGPDLSFFKGLRQQQAARAQSQMEVWGCDKRREIAELLSQGFMREVRWPISVFLPDDSFQVMCNGPAFGMLDNLGGIAVIQQLEEHYGARIPNSFWAGREHATFGEIVEALTVVLAPGPA